MRTLSTALILATLLVPQIASAHISVLDPEPRQPDQKVGPCGKADDMRGDIIHTFAPGETITIVWEEFVPHPGHYRISFDDDGFDSFVDPEAYDDFYTNDTVLIDNIPDMEGTETYMQEVTLPDIECDNCTIQVVQMMTDKPPYGDGNDLYYQCIDIVLESDGPSTDTDTDTDSTTDTDDPTTDGETDSETDSTTSDTTGTDTTEGPTDSDGETAETTDEGTTDETTGDGSDTGEGTTADTSTSGVDTMTDSGDTASGEDEGCGCTTTDDMPVGIAVLLAAGLLSLRRRPSSLV